MKLWIKPTILAGLMIAGLLKLVSPVSSATISQVNILTPQIGRYDKFEVQFNVATGSLYPNLPYDPNPPAGLKPGLGISVDALFSRDNWKTVIIQPAFLYQPFAYAVRGNRDHLTPNGAPRWVVRFTPQAAGTWQFRLRTQDAGGVSFYPSANGGLSFTVQGESANPYKRRGFLRVSPTDSRYFEFQDGTPFMGVGYNGGFGNITEAEQIMPKYEQYKMNFFRIWLSGAGINGSQWTSWASHHLASDGYLPGVNFDTQNTYNGADVSLRLDNTNPCFFADFWQGGVPAQPNTVYRLSARVKLNNVTGPATSGPYGFVIKRSDWLDTGCATATTGTSITTPQVGTTGWITITGSYTTGSDQYWLDNIYLIRQNATAGQVYLDEVRIWRQGDPAQVNLLREPNANSHLYFDSLNAAVWDKYIELAEAHGIYLKLVIAEKNEWLRNHIGLNGLMTPTASNDNFYAQPNTKVRWLEQAWWRYLIARWGYSPAIHSFEYVNEGDPYNGRHHEAANAMARYFDQFDPAAHMVSTSFWHSFPNQELWSNQNYANLDYADLHAYISTGWGLNASFLDPPQLETRSQHIRSGNASAKISGTDNNGYMIVPRGLVIRGPGEWIIRYWMKADRFSANCPFGTSGGMQRIFWLLDGGAFQGGKEGVVPFNQDGKSFICTSPAGSFNWTQFSSDRDRNGQLIPASLRLILTDSLPHEITLFMENQNGTGGTAWIDDVELVSPMGQVVPVIGQFDITPMDEDTAWYNRAYGDLFGGRSLVGARKPLVRGETGIDSPSQQEWNRDLNRDQKGIWLHNNVWGQVNSGGMYDLFWWAYETIDQNPDTGRNNDLYPNFLTYQNFMEDIPLTNGFYRDVGAQSSNPNLRVWGQRDDLNGRMHLWVQNKQHTWKRVVFGPAIPAISGNITIPNVSNGVYEVTWWDTYKINNPIISSQTFTATSQLILPLPRPLNSDIAAKIVRISGQGAAEPIYVPLVMKG